MGPPDSDGDGVSDSEDAYPKNGDRYHHSKTKEGEIEVDTYKALATGFPFGDLKCQYRFTVHDGGSVDIRIFDATEWKVYSHAHDQEPTPVEVHQDVFEIVGTVTALDVFDGGAAAYYAIENQPESPTPSRVEYELEVFA